MEVHCIANSQALSVFGKHEHEPVSSFISAIEIPEHASVCKNISVYMQILKYFECVAVINCSMYLVSWFEDPKQINGVTETSKVVDFSLVSLILISLKSLLNPCILCLQDLWASLLKELYRFFFFVISFFIISALWQDHVW